MPNWMDSVESIATSLWRLSVVILLFVISRDLHKLVLG